MSCRNNVIESGNIEVVILNLIGAILIGAENDSLVIGDLHIHPLDVFKVCVEEAGIADEFVALIPIRVDVESLRLRNLDIAAIRAIEVDRFH